MCAMKPDFFPTTAILLTNGKKKKKMQIKLRMSRTIDIWFYLIKKKMKWPLIFQVTH